MTDASPVRVLFVCMGNICRSPIVEGVFRKCLEIRASALVIEVDSAGTHSYHVDASPDHRAQSAAGRRGIDISTLRARRVEAADFERFDYILAMDQLNLETLRAEASAEYHDKIRLFMDFSRANPGAEVPDPYYGSANGFERVLDLAEEAAEGLLIELEKATGSAG